MSGRTRASGPRAAVLDVDALIGDRSTDIIVCCGSGGVGKTTTAASLALRAAEQGRRVVVLTIDPARRLAQSMGLTELDNTPRPVIGVDAAAGGSLDAMMLDMKRTFDEVVVAHSTPEKADQILANPFYQAVSSSFAGTQEYMAMEKLGQLHHAVGQAHQTSGSKRAMPTWDLIVVDTPPSRSALDFLDAPKRLGSFLDGRFIRLMTAPAKVGGRASLKVFNVGVGIVSSTLSRVLGGDLLRDVQTFISALDTMFGGFRERADQTYALLSRSSTAFLVVAAPERDALREASFFIARLESEQMPVSGLVLNRVQPMPVPGLSAARAGAGAEERAEEGDRLTAGLLTLHADLARLAERQRVLARRFVVGHPGTPVAEVPALAEDVHDVPGLRRVGAALAGL